MSSTAAVDKQATFRCQSCLKAGRLHRIGRFLFTNDADHHPPSYRNGKPSLRRKPISVVCKTCQTLQTENRLRSSLRDWSLVSSSVEIGRGGDGTGSVNDLNNGKGSGSENSKSERPSQDFEWSGKRKAKELEDSSSAVTGKYSTGKQDVTKPFFRPSVEKVELSARLSAFDSFLFLDSDDDVEIDGDRPATVSASSFTGCGADGAVSGPSKRGNRVNPTAIREGRSGGANVENAQEQGVLDALIREQLELRRRPMARVFPGWNFDDERDIIAEEFTIANSGGKSAKSFVRVDDSQSLSISRNGRSERIGDTTMERSFEREGNGGNNNIINTIQTTAPTTTMPTVRVEKWHDMIVHTVPGSLEEHRVLSDKLSAFDDYLLLADIDAETPFHT
ncbi:hypothetical protein ACHAXS_003667 [Conticribra weissflogii]